VQSKDRGSIAAVGKDAGRDPADEQPAQDD